MLISTQPKNEGERAALARSHQLTELVWTPVRDVPTLFQRKNCVLPAGVPSMDFRMLPPRRQINLSPKT